MTRTRWTVGLICAAAVAVCVAPGAQAAKVWTFDCGTQGWITTGNHTATWSDAGGEGKVTLTYNELPEPFDPVFQSPGDQGIDLNATPYIIIDFETAGLPDPTHVGLFIFSTGGAEAWRFGGNLPVGANRVVVDANAVDWGAPLWGSVQNPFDTEIGYFRFDIPDGPGYAEVAGGTVTVDYVAVAESGDFVPVQDSVDCGMVDTWRNLPINRIDAAPVMDGVVTAAEYPTTALPITQGLIDLFGSRSGGGSSTDEDVSGTFYIGWDATYLYCAAQVTDNVVVYNADQGEPLNGTDGIQLITDHRYLRGGTVGGTDGLLIHDLVPGQASDNATAAYYQHWPGDDGTQTQTITDVANDIAGRTVAGGYEVEMRIPWANFTPEPITPQIGALIGYVAIILDFDSAALNDLLANSAQLPWVSPGAAGWNTGLLLGPEDDLDGDGLTNEEEALYGTNPEMADTDGDGLSDYEEIAWGGDDTTYVPGVDLDPLNADTDGDGYPDGLEIRFGTNPLDPNDYPPPVPATSNTGLWILVALMLGAVVFTLAVRRARNHS